MSDLKEYNLVDVLRGRENGNPYVVPGDFVMVPEADAIFVMGNVITQRSIRFSDVMTLTRAIAMAGGVRKSSALVTVRIHHNSYNAPRSNPIMINLRAIKDGRAETLLLQPWDTVEVSDELGHFLVPRLTSPTWDPPPPKWNPPLHPPKETRGSTLITGASGRAVLTALICLDCRS